MLGSSKGVHRWSIRRGAGHEWCPRHVRGELNSNDELKYAECAQRTPRTAEFRDSARAESATLIISEHERDRVSRMVPRVEKARGGRSSQENGC